MYYLYLTLVEHLGHKVLISHTHIPWLFHCCPVLCFFAIIFYFSQHARAHTLTHTHALTRMHTSTHSRMRAHTCACARYETNSTHLIELILCLRKTSLHHIPNGKVHIPVYYNNVVITEPHIHHHTNLVM